MTKENTNIRFFYNGLKVVGSKDLYRAHYSFSKSSYGHNDDLHITIYARDLLKGLPVEINEYVEIKNDTDSMTDYFDKDRVVVRPGNTLWNDALAACIKASEKDQARHVKRNEKYNDDYDFENDSAYLRDQKDIKEMKTLLEGKEEVVQEPIVKQIAEVSLGNVGSLETVEKIKAAIEGQTSLDLQVNYGVMMGNYPTSITSKHEAVTEEEITSMVLFVLATSL